MQDSQGQRWMQLQFLGTPSSSCSPLTLVLAFAFVSFPAPTWLSRSCAGLRTEMPGEPGAAWDFLPVQLSPVVLNGSACLEGGVSCIVSVGRCFVCYHGSICTAAAAAPGSGSGEVADLMFEGLEPELQDDWFGFERTQKPIQFPCPCHG